MLGKLIPLLVASGISVHSAESVKERVQQARGLVGGFVTKQRMGTILRAARLRAASGEYWTVKNDKQFTQWIRKNIRIEKSDDIDPSLDTWGTPFRQATDRSGLTILSAGPDKLFGTPDDLKVQTKI